MASIFLRGTLSGLVNGELKADTWWEQYTEDAVISPSTRLPGNVHCFNFTSVRRLSLELLCVNLLNYPWKIVRIAILRRQGRPPYLSLPTLPPPPP